MSIKYSPEQLSALAADLRSDKGKLSETHDELKRYVQGLVATWDGAASAGYAEVQNKWDTANAELVETLETIAGVVEEGGITMAETDRSNAAIWG